MCPRAGSLVCSRGAKPARVNWNVGRETEWGLAQYLLATLPSPRLIRGEPGEINGDVG